VGSTRETTTAVLHKLREEGILDIANRRITVLDPAALERAARSS
jgi:CRP-like cAMP-binding protein